MSDYNPAEQARLLQYNNALNEVLVDVTRYALDGDADKYIEMGPLVKHHFTVRNRLKEQDMNEEIELEAKYIEEAIRKAAEEALGKRLKGFKNIESRVRNSDKREERRILPKMGTR
ncbi:hypothetical protein FQA39_LY11293 [Lamprigera yunnana]|nr:hypothetical protein FQA39_LY11293 [Lamprigera yunnana]